MRGSRLDGETGVNGQSIGGRWRRRGIGRGSTKLALPELGSAGTRQRAERRCGTIISDSGGYM